MLLLRLGVNLSLMQAFISGILALLFPALLLGQAPSVLFLGNSYTNYNNLPSLVNQLANSAGENLTVDSNTPGGYTLEGHTTNATTLQKLASGNYDFVVFQEQSQRPSFPQGQVEQDVFPFAKKLDSLARVGNPCVQTLFYMTWGRENGDASNCVVWPPICTYEGMDDLLYQRYMQMANDNEAQVAPVGRLWRYLRTNHPSIDLYTSDGSHPSFAGSYAAATAFYTLIFKQDPTLLTFDGSLTAIQASTIRDAAKTVVYDSLPTWTHGNDLFNRTMNVAQVQGNTYFFEYTGTENTNIGWTYDGQASTSDTFSYTFPNPGVYPVSIVAYPGSCDSIIATDTVVVLPSSINHTSSHPITIHPNPGAQVTISGITQSTPLVVYNQLGAAVYRQNYTPHTPVDLSKLPSGRYFIHVGNEVVQWIRR